MRLRCLVILGGLLLLVLALHRAATAGTPQAGQAGSAGSHAAARAGSVTVRDLDGRLLRPFEPSGTAGVIFFLTSDCPISNGYAEEIQRICRAYGSRGVSCSLMYEDVEVPGSRVDADARRNLQEYRYDGIPAAVDRDRAVAVRAQASVTPTAVVVDTAGAIRYRGRIDNFYAALGRPRQQVTERDLRAALDAVLAGRPVARPETQAVGCFIVDPAILRD